MTLEDGLLGAMKFQITFVGTANLFESHLRCLRRTFLLSNNDDHILLIIQQKTKL